MKNQNRRKHFLVHKPFQLRYLFYAIALLSTVIIVALTGTHFGIWGSVIQAFSPASMKSNMITAQQIHEYEQARIPKPFPRADSSLRRYEAIELLSAREREVINEIISETDKKNTFLIFLLLLFIGWGSVFVTHKVAGPLFKLKQYLNHVRSGDLTARIKFRKFDEMQDLAPHFNAMTAEFDAAIGKLKKMARETPSHQLSQAIEKELSRFKTTGDSF